jgi:outer membrane protein insertion porin family
LIFIEGGNNWNNYQNFIFFNLKKSVGLGVRVFVPMFGLVGVDFGYGFNKDFIQNKISGWQSTISVGSNLY